MNELAQAFFHAYRQRISNGLPQQSYPARKTLLERAVETYQHGGLTETVATLRVEREGFSDVVLRFHTVNRDLIPLRFYEATPKAWSCLMPSWRPLRMRCTLRQPVAPEPLEAAIAMHLPVAVLGTDEHMLYRTTDYERVDITGTHPVPGGYQNSLCFSSEVGGGFLPGLCLSRADPGMCTLSSWAGARSCFLTGCA